ncbi:lipin Ned1, partial [Coemansia nantahalensis]
MQYFGKVISTVSQLYKELNPATLSGAIDVVVVEGEDGELSCSPFHVRFGKLQLLRPSDKAVQVIVNGRPAEFYMKVGDSGEGFFVLETVADVPAQFATSPVASPALSFRADDDPYFLDLGADVRVQDMSRDGYVSAASAHKSDADDPPSGDSGPHLPPSASRRHARSSSVALARPDGVRRQSFSDDMAIDLRQGIESLAARAAHLGSEHGGAGGAAAADSPASDSAEIHTDWDWGVGIEPANDTPALLTATPGPDPANAWECDPQPHGSGGVDIAGIIQAHPEHALALSLCGFDRLRAAGSAEEQQQIFDDARVSASSYAGDAAAIMASPDLVFRLGDSTYMERDELVTSLVSQLAFGLPLASLTRASAADPEPAASTAADAPEVAAAAKPPAIDIPAAASKSTGDLPLDAPFAADEGAGYASDGEQHMHYAKTLRLTSAQLKSLDLQRG